MTDPQKHILDAASAATAVGALAGWLPSIASLLTIVWMCLRIYDWFKGRA